MLGRAGGQVNVHWKSGKWRVLLQFVWREADNVISTPNRMAQLALTQRDPKHNEVLPNNPFQGVAVSPR
jgi:hypothetical protein